MSDVIDLVEDEGCVDTMIVVNHIVGYMNMATRVIDNEKVIELFQKSSSFMDAWVTRDWTVYNDCSIDYRTPTSSTKMSTVVLYKKKLI